MEELPREPLLGLRQAKLNQTQFQKFAYTLPHRVHL